MELNSTLTIGQQYVRDLPNLIVKDFTSNLINLALYSIAMVLYVIVIYHFYRMLARKDTYHIESFQMPVAHPIFHALKELIMFLIRTLIIFPVISFVWFLVLSGFLLFLSKSQDVSQVLLISMTLIAVARITAYYNEELSKDVAKLVPFALLGIFIVDPTYFTIEGTLTKFRAVPLFLHQILQYLILIVLLEFILRVYYRVMMRVSTPSYGDN